jgi:peptide/nickel transport system substrate-binding protein
MAAALRTSALALTAVLVAVGGCSTVEPPEQESAPSAEGTACPESQELTATYKRPTVTPSGNVTAAVEGNINDYNNNTGTANNFVNSVLSLAQPSAFFIDNQLGVCVDGDVMESVEQTSDSPLTVTYKIRPEAVWSDGEPVSCKDFYLEWLSSTSAAKTAEGTAAFDPAGTTGYDQMNPPECGDAGKTVTTTYRTPFADWRSMFDFMVPAHVIEKASGVSDVTALTADDTGADVQRFAAAYIEKFTGFDPAFALSAGPYLLQSHSDEQSVLVRNDKWWGEPAGPESLTLVTNADGQSQVQALQNQEVQVIAPQPDAALAQQLRAAEGITFNAYAGLTYEHIDFQMKLSLFQGKTGDALREAVFHCVDRTDIIAKLVREVNPDTKPLGNFMFTPDDDSYQDHYQPYQTADVAKAKQVMEAAGWTVGGDGIYQAGDKRAEFRLGHRVIDNRQRISQLVQGSCAKAGIKIVDDQDAEFNNDRLPAGDFDTALFAWVGTPFTSSSTGNYITGGGANYNSYSNPEVDKLFKSANSDTDLKRRDETLNELDQLMAADRHSLPLYQFSDMVAHRETISPTLTYNGIAGGVFWNAFEWVSTG